MASERRLGDGAGGFPVTRGAKGRSEPSAKERPLVVAATAVGRREPSQRPWLWRCFEWGTGLGPPRSRPRVPQRVKWTTPVATSKEPPPTGWKLHRRGYQDRHPSMAPRISRASALRRDRYARVSDRGGDIGRQQGRRGARRAARGRAHSGPGVCRIYLHRQRAPYLLLDRHGPSSRAVPLRGTALKPDAPPA
jgi:hypothetical protein